MSLNYSFAGKRVLVTGGGSGIGRRLVQRFYQDGATVFTVDKNADSLNKLKEELPNLITKVCDLSNWEETKNVVEGFGVIDCLVNNAGILGSLPFLEVTKEELESHYKVNLFGLINVSQVVAKGLSTAGKSGTIVNMSSMSARFGIPALTTYATTKAAVENLTKSMAIELGAHNIRVNCILPHAVNTPLLNNFSPELQQALPSILERNVVKRIVETDEIVDLVMFLLSPLSTMIIGQGVVIDGGFLIS